MRLASLPVSVPFALLVLAPNVVGADASAADAVGPTLAPGTCLERLDAAVSAAENGDERGARRLLERLAERCEHLPQIRHDLGVLAARAGRVDEAIDAFEASLAEDARAAMTVAHLRDLHRREASAAYARALGLAGGEKDPAPPALTLQDSTDVNADALREAPDRSGLRTPSTLEYELYAWWHSADDDSAEAWLAHYAEGYPRRLAIDARARPDRPPWDRVRREIAFTAEDAVALLEFGRGEEAERRLLLLRLQGNRWKIYRESAF